MSFDHKAYAFDWHSFSGEMLPWLTHALERNDCTRFRSFIQESMDACSDPYDGEPLAPDWEETVDVNDVQQLADFALTKYYEPSDDHGLSGIWIELDERLPSDLKLALLGRSIDGFDPSRQGSYFVKPDDAWRYASMLRGVADEAVQEYARFLARAASEGRGLYVTF